MHKDCIILTADFDTDTADRNICLSKINGTPFLEILSRQLKHHHICKVVFALADKGRQIKDYVLAHRNDFDFAFDFSETEENYGSGGAIMDALQYSDTTDVIIVNGWQFNTVNLDDIIAWQQTKYGDVTIAAKHIENCRHYQQLHINDKSLVFDFSKRETTEGIINSGTYCMFRPSFLNINFPQKFSFTKDYIEKHATERDIIGMVQDGQFFDISLEEDIVSFSQYVKQAYAKHK